jgi:hypothetical protein
VSLSRRHYSRSCSHNLANIELYRITRSSLKSRFLLLLISLSASSSLDSTLQLTRLQHGTTLLPSQSMSANQLHSVALARQSVPVHQVKERERRKRIHPQNRQRRQACRIHGVPAIRLVPRQELRLCGPILAIRSVLAAHLFPEFLSGTHGRSNLHDHRPPIGEWRMTMSS